MCVTSAVPSHLFRTSVFPCYQDANRRSLADWYAVSFLHEDLRNASEALHATSASVMKMLMLVLLSTVSINHNLFPSKLCSEPPRKLVTCVISSDPVNSTLC